MGKIYCSECGSEHDDSDSFCEKCGKPLINTKTTTIQNNRLSNDKIIVIAVIGVIILISVGILASGVLTPTPLKHVNFGLFGMDVPEDSDFQEYNSFSILNSYHAIYENKGFNSEEFSTITVSNEPIENSVPVLVEQTGNMKLYKSNDMQISKFGEFYDLILEKDGFYFSLSGSNQDLLKEVAETIVVENTY